MKVVHCKRELYTHYIGRGSLLGNPFTYLPIGNTKATVQVATRDESVDFYFMWLLGDERFKYLEPKRRLDILKWIVQAPENSVLGCFCHPLRCHGDILVMLKDKHNSDPCYLGNL